MICETCHGRRFIERRAAGECPVEEPCPDCGGFGIVHCCEGERPGNPLPGNRPAVSLFAKSVGAGGSD